MIRHFCKWNDLHMSMRLRCARYQSWVIIRKSRKGLHCDKRSFNCLMCKWTLLLLELIRHHQSVISSNAELIQQQAVWVSDRVHEDIRFKGRKEGIWFVDSIFRLLFKLSELFSLHFDFKYDAFLFMLGAHRWSEYDRSRSLVSCFPFLNHFFLQFLCNWGERVSI